MLIIIYEIKNSVKDKEINNMAYHIYKSYKIFIKIRQCYGTQGNEPSLKLLAHSVRMHK